MDTIDRSHAPGRLDTSAPPHRRSRRRHLAFTAGMAALLGATLVSGGGHVGADPVTSRATHRINVPGAAGKTVTGQLTVDNAIGVGFITAWNCEGDRPSNSDLNFNGPVDAVASNRMIVDAGPTGDICLFIQGSADLIVDVNGTTDDIDAIPNKRFDTRGTAGSPVGAGETFKINVPEAAGKTAIGQLTVDRATDVGFITAWNCEGDRPSNSDLNYNGFVDPVASNRLIVQAGPTGDICFFTNRPVDLIVDINGTTDDIDAIPNLRVDTRNTSPVGAGQMLKVNVPAAAGKTVIGQLTADRVVSVGFVTAWNCVGGPPLKSDLNYNGAVDPVSSNRLIVDAGPTGDICFFTNQQVDLIVDINGTTDDIDAIPNQRFDTRHTTLSGALSGANEVPAGSGDPAGTGTAAVELDKNGGRICFTLTLTGLAGTVVAAHIHDGPAGVNGPVAVNLDFPTNGLTGCVEATGTVIDAIALDPAGFYVNVHSSSFPAGAVRGQLVRA